MKGNGFKVVPVLVALSALLVVGLAFTGCGGDDDPWKPPTDQSIMGPVGSVDQAAAGSPEVICYQWYHGPGGHFRYRVPCSTPNMEYAAGVRDPGGNVAQDLDGVRDPGGNIARDPYRDTTVARLGMIRDGMRDTTAH